MATKAFWGPNAQSLGAPTGSGSGNSSFVPSSGIVVPQFVRVDGGVFQPGDTPATFTRGGNTILAYDFSGTSAFGRSTDAGLTWSRIVPNVPAGTTLLFPTAANATGSVFCGNGTIAGSPAVLTSVDGGLNWTETTPAGSFVNGPPFYSEKFDSFVVWDNANVNLLYYTSPDGVTWSSAASVGFTLSGETLIDGQTHSCVFGLSQIAGGTGSPQVWITADGLTWAPVFTPGDVDAEFGDTRSACSNIAGTFFVLFFDSVNSLNRLYRSIDDGLTWTEQSSGDGNAAPPFAATIQAFDGFYVNAADNDTDTVLARTADGVTFIPVTLAVPDVGEPRIVFTSGDGTTLFAFSSGVASTTSYPAFGAALISPAEIFDMTSGAGYALAVGDAGGGDAAIWRVTTP